MSQLRRTSTLLARLAACLALAGCRTVPAGAPPAPTQTVDPATAAARDALRREATLDVRSIPERAIAVPPLVVRASDTSLVPLGYGLADMLMTDLARSQQVAVVERSRLDAMLRELHLAEAGQVDSAQAPRVGRLLGARRLVVGTLSDRGNGELGIETRLANTVDGTLAGVVSARAPLASIFDAEKALAYRVFEELGVTLTPGERAAIEQRPTANATAFLAYSRGVRDEALGQYGAAAANYRQAVTLDPGFGAARARLERAQTAQQTSAATAAPDAKSTGTDAKSESKTAPATAVGASGAAALAGGAVNPSPVATLGTTSTATSTQAQTAKQDQAAPQQQQPVLATVVITVKQLP